MPNRSNLLGLEQQDGAVTEVEVDEVLRLCEVISSASGRLLDMGETHHE
jgi:hypothetical protein